MLNRLLELLGSTLEMVRFNGHRNDSSETRKPVEARQARRGVFGDAVP